MFNLMALNSILRYSMSMQLHTHDLDIHKEKDVAYLDLKIIYNHITFSLR